MANNKRSTGANLYVKNFGKDIDESKLCQLFSAYGTITSCKVINLMI
jgi:RNA recognition motif-containing protein